jgi:hypothetical protein
LKDDPIGHQLFDALNGLILVAQWWLRLWLLFFFFFFFFFFVL